METSLRVLGQDHRSILGSMCNFASTYRNQERLEEAEDLELRVITTSSRMLGQQSGTHADLCPI